MGGTSAAVLMERDAVAARRKIYQAWNDRNQPHGRHAFTRCQPDEEFPGARNRAGSCTASNCG